VKFSQLINYPLGWLGFKMVRTARLQLVNTIDIDDDAAFMTVYAKMKPYTMVEKERCYALYQSVLYILQNNIPGHFVECGVWKGGSAMLIAFVLLQRGISDRKIYLYDTFEGMAKPGEMDGPHEKAEWESMQVTETLNKMCYAPVEEVKTNLAKTGYPADNILWVKGKVEETIPGTIPQYIALLRLDTDWYESTKHELVHLYPLLSAKGVLIIDDYGAWQGARKAVDEYLTKQGAAFLHRIDWTGRLLIKE
jgi:O-methyltransferase